MKVYIASVYVGNYEITAVAETPKKCINAIVREYHSFSGGFKENGFSGRADWLDYHGLSEASCQEVELNTAFTR